MKYHLLWIVGFALLIPVSTGCAQSTDTAAAQPDSVTWMPFEEALESSKTLEKKVLVFVYTQWCGWCRKMMDSTFTDEAVLAYMTDSFATVRLDAEGTNTVNLEAQSRDGTPLESITEAQLAMALGASGFPTTVFLEGNGTYITRLPSYLPANDYLDVLRYIGGDHYKTQSFDEYMASTGD